MATKEERISKLEQRKAQIKAQIQALKARDSVRERKDDTRRKILIGGFVLAQIKKKGGSALNMTYDSARFVETLKNENDRKLFGLAPLAADAALSPPKGGAVSKGNTNE